MNNVNISPNRQSLNQSDNSPSKKKFKPTSLAFVLMGLFLLLLGYFFLFIPNQVLGSNQSIFPKSSLILSEKITYLFRSPKVGDIVTFKASESPDFLNVGLIADYDESSTPPQFTITTQKESLNPYLVARSEIKSKVYFPSFDITPPYTRFIITPTPSPEPTQTPSPSPKPTLIPTRKATSIPIQNSTPVPVQSTPIPTQTQVSAPEPTAQALRCEVVANPKNEGVPQTYNLIYSAFYSGSNNYVTGAQWDFNGDGNWDTDLSLLNGNVNYTYSTPGIYTINLKVQDNTGATANCSKQIGVQPH